MTAPIPVGAPATGSITVKPRRLPRGRRNIELILLLVAIAMGWAAIFLVEAGSGQSAPGFALLAAVPAALVIVVHIALRITAVDADPFILPIMTALNGLGLAMIYRLDLAEGYEGWAMNGVRQVVWTVIAVVLAGAVLLMLRNHRILQRYTYLAMLVGIVLLLLPFIPGLGSDQGTGSQLWVSLGVATFQPGEFAKIALAVFFAGYLVQHRDALSSVGPKFLGLRLPRAKDLGPILIVWAASMVVLVGQRDLGTSLLYFGLFLVMLYVATGRFSWILIGLLLFVGGALAAWRLLPYVAFRFTAWLDAFNPEYVDGVSYQLVQGMFGMSSGELLGTGLGRGNPDIVPLAESDFIIPSLGEELGLIGLFAILAMYLLLVSRGFRIGFAGQDDFGKLLSVGLAFTIALQCFIVIGGVTRVIPLTGLTTPFLSAGGSALVANWVIGIILLRISDSVRNQPRLVV